MPQIRKKISIAAGAAAFPIQGSQYEFMQFDGLVEFAVREITGTAAEGVLGSVFSGSDVLLENSEIDYVEAGLNIQYPWDYNLSDVAAAGERLGVQLTNPGTGAAEVIVSVRITPAA